MVIGFRFHTSSLVYLAGTLKSFLGLSASLMSTIYVAAFQPDGLSFLLFVACLPVAVGIVTIPFLNQVPYVEVSEIEDQHQYLTTGEEESYIKWIALI